ncbi:PHP domain-containing protein [Finegoldia magna]|uniref:PHP domain-containing protein n=2 Tax=Finegoldia magna TaxID=1260 RepID=UPI0027B87FA7|nr:PHP domain-containing protein [Finegoldia magna]MDU5368706.1 PHP domain-containing protein [Finegoldia magna]
MKAVDLHIHTVKSISDSQFTFSMESLIKYVDSMKLDIIGITNHNLFDIEQFNHICDRLDVKVLPGIEINFEGGHLLLLSENEELEDFSKKCKKVEEKIGSPSDNIDKNELVEIFVDLGKYLLIPHNPKKPKVPIQVINEMDKYIDAIEVSSIKDFLREHNNNDDFVPVWFSDIRISNNLDTKKRGRIYLDIDNDSLKSIKLALSDKNKVKLTIDESNSLFPINNESFQVSTGLNVLLGARSSGKSYFLNEVESTNENVKYIRQFSLLDKQNLDNKEFDVRLSNENSVQAEKMFIDFKNLIEEISSIDFKKIKKNVDDYVESLLKFANEEERRDVFSKSKLYTQNLYPIKEIKSIDKLINSIENLIINKEYKKIIESHLNIIDLKNLVIELSKLAKSRCKENIIRQKANEIIEDVKPNLEIKTVSNKIIDVDLKEYLSSQSKIEKFNDICELVKKERTVELDKIGKFTLIMKTGYYKNVTEIKKHTNRKIALSDIFKYSYKDGYEYLQKLSEVNIPKVDYWKYYVNVKFDIINELKLSASGGERTEYNLLNEIKSANNYDILLIDEPESSFDNRFLNEEVNTLIKDISKKIPVILATHNNAMGLSINPDYILYTKRESSNGDIEFKIYSGNIASKKLTCFENEDDTVETYEILMDSLEAGEDAYKEREKTYELHKN